MLRLLLLLARLLGRLLGRLLLSLARLLLLQLRLVLLALEILYLIGDLEAFALKLLPKLSSDVRHGFPQPLTIQHPFIRSLPNISVHLKCITIN
jgi:hypothetical protein